MANIALRLATAEDAKAVADIYHDYVAHTVISFERVPPTAQEMERRIISCCAVYPFLVCIVDDRVVGYAYATRQMERAAYDWNAEVSVYLDKTVQGKGIGRALYEALEKLLRAMGVVNLYARMAEPNPRSKQLHVAMGYTEIGRLHKTGFKQGKWWDVIYFEKHLALHDTDHAPIRSVRELDPGLVEDVLAYAVQQVRL